MREMKDSGVAWLGDIPQSWNCEKGKYHFSNNKFIPGINSSEYDRLALTLKGVIHRPKDDADGLQPKDFDTYQLLREGELVFKLIDLQNISTSRVGLAHDTGLVSPAYIVLKPSNDILPEYAQYFYLSMWHREIFNALGDNGVRSNLGAADLLNVKITIPPMNEQITIAKYLDSKCAEIDYLAADIQSQIDTLEQYKRTVIAEAVTKGLDPDAEMKDSGIEWVGEIPAHWNTDKGKYCLRYVQKPTRPDDDVITCFRDGEVTLRKNRREDGFTVSLQEIGYQGIDVGDLIVHGMDGFAGSIGISDSRGKASPVLNVLDTDHNKRYIMYYLRNMAYEGVFLALATGIRVRTCDTNWGKLRELPYLLPPKHEQDTIADYIDSKLEATDELINEKKNQLEVLEEYKKSLIYEYVTGKKEILYGTDNAN